MSRNSEWGSFGWKPFGKLINHSWKTWNVNSSSPFSKYITRRSKIGTIVPKNCPAGVQQLTACNPRQKNELNLRHRWSTGPSILQSFSQLQVAVLYYELFCSRSQCHACSVIPSIYVYLLAHTALDAVIPPRTGGKRSTTLGISECNDTAICVLQDKLSRQGSSNGKKDEKDNYEKRISIPTSKSWSDDMNNQQHRMLSSPAKTCSSPFVGYIGIAYMNARILNVASASSDVSPRLDSLHKCLTCDVDLGQQRCGTGSKHRSQSLLSHPIVGLEIEEIQAHSPYTPRELDTERIFRSYLEFIAFHSMRVAWSLRRCPRLRKWGVIFLNLFFNVSFFFIQE